MKLDKGSEMAKAELREKHKIRKNFLQDMLEKELNEQNEIKKLKKEKAEEETKERKPVVVNVRRQKEPERDGKERVPEMKTTGLSASR